MLQPQHARIRSCLAIAKRSSLGRSPPPIAWSRAPVRLSFFDCLTDAVPKPQNMSWDDFCANLESSPCVVDKRQAPCFSPAEYADDAPRRADRVIALHLAVLDLDALAEADLNALAETLEPFAYASHTTLSHPAKSAKTPDRWALRFILPLDRPVPVADWPLFWQNLHQFTGGHADPQCKDPSRMYILPCRYPTDDPPVTECHPGSFLPVTLIQGQPTPQNATQLNCGPLAPIESPLGQRLDKAALQNRLRALAQSRDETSHTLAANLRALLAGQAYGCLGKRHATMLAMTGELDRLFPNAEPEAIADLFAPSQVTMQAIDATPPDTIDAVLQAVVGARRKRLERRQALTQQTATAKQSRIAHARQDGATHPYTADEIDGIAAMHGIPAEDLPRHWILRHGSQAYFLGLHGYSAGYPTAHGILPTAAEFLAPASQCNLHEIRGRGADAKSSLRSWDAVCADYATNIPKVVYDLHAQHGRLDYANSQLHLASAPRKRLTPTEHPQIHEWLTLLGGDKAEKFLHWVAAVPDMTKKLCAVYLHGAQGVGKTVFAHALSKLWQRGTPTPFATAVSKFNYDLAQCPLVLVDEGFPNLPPKQLAIELRALIGGDEIRVEQKFSGSLPLLGPTRLIMAANNTSLLDFKSDLSHDDLAALAIRIMQVTPDARARDAFASLTPEEFRAWQTHKIAEHALWLAENRAAAHAPGTRFHVQGELDESMRQVVVDGHFTSLACQVLVRYIADIRRKTELKQGLIRFGNGELLVNQEGLSDIWQSTLSHGPHPPTQLGVLLRSLSDREVSKNIRVGRMIKRFWHIDLRILATWCDSNGYLSEEILALIYAPRADLAVN